MTPVNGRAECLMPRQCGATSSGEGSKSIGERFEELLSCEASVADGGELMRRRQAVEPPAEMNDRGLIRVGQLEGAGCRCRPLRKQHHGFVLSQLTERYRSVPWR